MVILAWLVNTETVSFDNPEPARDLLDLQHFQKVDCESVQSAEGRMFVKSKYSYASRVLGRKTNYIRKIQI